MKPDDKEINSALNFIELLANPELNIMVGYGHRLDRPIIRRVLQLGGNVIISLPEGLFDFKIRNDLKDVWNEKHILIVTFSAPKQRWNPTVAAKSKDLSLSFANAALITDPAPQWLTHKKYTGLDIPLFHIYYEYQSEIFQKLSDIINIKPIVGKNQLSTSHIMPIYDALKIKNLKIQPLLTSIVEKSSSNKFEPPALQTGLQIKEKESAYSPLQLDKNKEESNITTKYPKRLIEVDLPIKKISEHARREKSIRHGHIYTLHIWWARRPLAACRAVLCAALWPDPGDPLCPEEFKQKASGLMQTFWDPMGVEDRDFDDPLELRKALLDFIADFANWDNSTKKEYLETSRALTQTAHEAMGGIPGTRPLVVDPFAGGGAIPLEALRVGADAFASDLNPVAVLLNKVVLEYIPKYGQQLADEVRKWGLWIKLEAEKELAEFYPKDQDGATPIAYLWARTIQCEGPECGVKVPLIRSLWLAKKRKKSIALQMIPKPQKKCVDFKIFENVKAQNVGEGTVRRGSVTCPCCGFTTPVVSVRNQLKARKGGAADAQMFCVVSTRPGQRGRFYRLPTEMDLESVKKAKEELDQRKKDYKGALSLVPDEPTPLGGGSGAGRAFSQRNYGMDRFEDLFTPRQALALTTLTKLVRKAGKKATIELESGLATAVQMCLGLAVSKSSDLNNALCTFRATSQCIDHLFARQAIPITWDFAEAL